MAVTINSYADVQRVLKAFVAASHVRAAAAPHHLFFATMSYADFVNGYVPGVNPKFKVLIKNNSKGSSIIQALSGTPGTPFDPNTGSIKQMPRPRPPYNGVVPSQQDVIQALSAWIDKGCPENASTAKPGAKPAKPAKPAAKVTPAAKPKV